jgi:hypothetical protein
MNSEDSVKINTNQNLAILTILTLGLTIAYEASAQRGRRPDPNMRKREEAVRRVQDIQYTSIHKMAGCGLGSLAFKEEDKWNQVGASLLNGTGMQTFAISFGTSNCTYDGVMEARLEREAFIEANYADLGRDIILGEGEYVSAMANFYGCGESEKAVFVENMQRSREDIVRSQGNTALVLDLADRAGLAAGCPNS